MRRKLGPVCIWPLMVFFTLIAALGASPQVFNPATYLPVGTKVAEPAQKYLRFSDLDGDGKPEVVIFFRCKRRGKPGTGVLVLEKKGVSYQRVGQEVHRGVGWSFMDPTGIYELSDGKKRVVVVYTSVGASCGGIMDIIRFQNGAMRIRSFDCAHKVEFKDLDHDGSSELIVNSLNYGANDRIFKWNGERFARADSDFPHYYDATVHGLLEDFQTTHLLYLGFQIEEIFRIQKRYREALALLDSMLTLVDRSDQLQSQKNEEKVQIELDKADAYLGNNEWAKALQQYGLALASRSSHQGRIRVLMGDVYFQVGQYEQAFETYHSVVKRLDGANLGVAYGSPEESRAYLRMGEIHSRQGQKEQAGATYQQAVRLWPDDQEAWRKLAPFLAKEDRQKVSRLYLQVGDWYASRSLYGKAVQAYREALSRDPSNQNTAKKLRQAQKREAQSSPCAGQ